MRYFPFLCLLMGLAACNNNGITTTKTTTDSTSTAAAAAPVAAQKPTVENDSQRIEYFANGNEKINVRLKAGKMEGTYQTNYENGRAKEKGTMAADLKTGVWNTYDSLGKLQQVALYAKDKLVKEMDASDYTMDTKRLTAEKMQFTMPHNWQPVDVGANPMVIMVAEKPCMESDKFCPNFTFTKEPLDGKGTFEDYISYGGEILKNFPGFKVVSQGKTTINGYKAYRMEYRGKAESISLGSIMTLYYSKDTVYILNCMAKDMPKGAFNEYQNLFMEISNSVKPL